MKFRPTHFGVAREIQRPHDSMPRASQRTPEYRSPDRLTLAMYEDSQSAPPASLRTANAAARKTHDRKANLLTVQESG